MKSDKGEVARPRRIPVVTTDLMITKVLRVLNHTDIVISDAPLAAYIARCIARRAYERPFDAQIGQSTVEPWRRRGVRAFADAALVH
jgi:hypothetical protein